MVNPLNKNYMTLSTNRFVVDTPRAWRPEYNPRFKDLFTLNDYQSILNNVNNELSFKLSNNFILQIASMLYEFFSDYRFIYVVQKNPESPKMFLSHLYFVLLDHLDQISVLNYPLTDDDFNVILSKAETGKADTTKSSASQDAKNNTDYETDSNYNTNSSINDRKLNSFENTNEENNQNTKNVVDTFTSPQDQGVTPTVTNSKGEGVDGVTIPSGAKFNSSGNVQNTGDSSINISTSNSETNEMNNNVNESTGTNIKGKNHNETSMSTDTDITNVKNDIFTQQQTTDKISKLNELFNINDTSLWLKMLKILSQWILQIDMANSDRNYVDCPYYD